MRDSFAVKIENGEVKIADMPRAFSIFHYALAI
jgi:hypothetical protein